MLAPRPISDKEAELSEAHSAASGWMWVIEHARAFLGLLMELQQGAVPDGPAAQHIINGMKAYDGPGANIGGELQEARLQLATWASAFSSSVPADRFKLDTIAVEVEGLLEDWVQLQWEAAGSTRRLSAQWWAQWAKQAVAGSAGAAHCFSKTATWVEANCRHWSRWHGHCSSAGSLSC